MRGFENGSGARFGRARVSMAGDGLAVRAAFGMVQYGELLM
jgi:hypothetical protein